ncbi:hypothetical protein [Psychromonas sp. KJ10-2]|uniref:hypothetical protein n=1 Tax=Psychromonas sp. KJ10-2 TaxID=3391822 RepID=UPI0039B629B9
MHTTEAREEALDDIERLKKASFYRFSKQKKQQVKNLQEVVIREEQTMQTKIDYFKQSKFKPRCLSCASHQIRKLKPFTTYMDHYFSLHELPAEPMGIIHSCGGEIEASLQARFNLNSNYRARVIEFDEQGLVINKPAE